MRTIRSAYATAIAILVTGLCASTSSGAPDTGPSTQPVGHVTRVAIYHDKGSNDKGLTNVSKCLAVQGVDFSSTAITAEEIRAGALKNFDVLVQPGGSGSKQAEELQLEGREKIQSFVKGGGGYIGICAGAYLATPSYSWSLGLINVDVVDRKHWARGMGPVQIGFLPEGKQLLGIDKNDSAVEYAQGPLLAKGDRTDLPPCQPLATFQTEMAKKGAPTGVMVGTIAIASGIYGNGRVMCISPHPERSPGLDGLIRHAVAWADSTK